MKVPSYLKIIVYVAAIRYLALSATDLLYKPLPEDTFISVFHYPANAVIIVALLVAGYWAVLGIALGSTIWNFLHTSISLSSHCELFLASVISCSLSLWIYKTFVKPTNNSIWERPSLFQFLLFSFIFSLCVVGAAQLAFTRIPEIDPLSVTDLSSMLMGNFIAVTVVYVLLNLLMSLYIFLLKSNNRI